MQYDDQARRYNFFSGMAFGLVLGTGLGLLTRPRKKIQRARPARGDHLRERAARALRSTRRDGKGGQSRRILRMVPGRPGR